MVKKHIAWQFIVLPLVVYLVVIIIPFFQSIVFSFTNWNGMSREFDFIGFRNYLRVFTEKSFSAALWHNVIWMFIFLLIPTMLGLLVAIILDRDIVLTNIFKSIIYLPMIFSMVIVGLIWNFVYQPELGILNLLLRLIGIKNWRIAWLARPQTALFAVIAAASWQHTGLCMILFLAGLRSIRGDLIEAARIDGCNSRQLYLKVILPQLQNATVVVVSLTIISSLKSFGIVYVMTAGGPFRSTEILTTLMYRESFWNYRMGYGSAISVVHFILILLIIVLYLRRTMSE
jgi:multiple sugar transport system permease protein/raffinose/stachyose/melibiose transport system permease protein